MQLSDGTPVTTLADDDLIPVITGPGVAGGNAVITPGDLAADLAARTAFTSRYTPLAGAPWRHKGSAAWLAQLASGVRPTSLLVIGDSTGNGTDEWVYLLGQWLAARYPAYTVAHRLYNDTSQSWDPATIIATGTAGEARFDAGTTNTRNFAVLDNTLISIVGDLSVRVKLSRANWGPGGTVAECFNKFGGAGQRSWSLTCNSSGALILVHSVDGTAQKTSVSSVLIPFAAGATGWVRADLDVDNGSAGYTVTFYTSTDGLAWTQLGTPQTVAGVSSVFDSNASLQICDRGATNAEGIYYAADLFSGIGANATLVASWRPGEMFKGFPALVLSGLDVRGNTWTANSTATTQGITGAPQITICNASMSGQFSTYFDATKLAKMTGTDFGLAIISLGHNTISSRAELARICDALIVARPDAGIVLSTQNPEISPPVAANLLADQTEGRRILTAFAASRNYGFVDAYTALLPDLVNNTQAGDGIHPTALGSALWASTVEDFLVRA